MVARNTNAQNQSATQAQISALGERMDRGFTELKEIIAGLDNRMRSMENREAGCHPLVTARIDAAWKAIDQNKTDIAALKTEVGNDVKALRESLNTQQQAITSLQHAVKIGTWVLSLLGSAVVIWLVTSVLKLIGT